MKKKLVIYVLIIALVVFAGYLYDKNGSFSKKQPAEIKKVSVSLKLPENTNFKEFNLNGQPTALELLQDEAKITTKGQGIDAYVTTINGRIAQDSKKEYWAFYINGKLSTVGAGSYTLRQGDRIEWKIANY